MKHARYIASALALFSLMAGCQAQADAQTEPMMTSQNAPLSAPQGCTMIIDFAETAAKQAFAAINDGVMGGRSSGGPRFVDDTMIFSGVINTNGGGFSSVRAGMAPGLMAGAKAVQMRIKQDARRYKLTFRTSERWRGRPVSFQVPIPATSPGEWVDITVDLSNPDASVFGRPVRGANFTPADIREIGIIIADGIDGPFELAVRSMACR